MKTLLQIAAALQLSILVASALVPRLLDWRTNLATLHPFLRKLFWVYGAFIAIFWAARLVVQLLIFDPRPFLTNWFYKLGYHTLTFIFVFLVFVYGKAAL